jgi:hypothetical protein
MSESESLPPREARRLFQRIASFVVQKGKRLTRVTGSIVFSRRWAFNKGGLNILYYRSPFDDENGYCGMRVRWKGNVAFESFGPRVNGSPGKLNVRIFHPGQWQKKVITRRSNHRHSATT